MVFWKSIGKQWFLQRILNISAGKYCGLSGSIWTWEKIVPTIEGGQIGPAGMGNFLGFWWLAGSLKLTHQTW
jgi:hypothetical protein